MSQAEPMHFRPSARLQKYLGRELIGDPNLAIIEFVKNAYDAGAEMVVVQFELNGPGSGRLVISDDGIGMDEAAFRHHWLRPGYSEKSPDFKGEQFTTATRSDSHRRRAGRPPAGEKGLGRLSAGRLGDRLEIWTRPSPRVQWLHVDIDWSTFNDMSKPMDSVPVPFDFVNEPPVEHARTGTVLQISGLRQKWVGRVPGRPSPGRRRTRLGRLKQDLEFLLRPMSGSATDFTIDLRSDSVSDAADVGIIKAGDSEMTSGAYRYLFTLDVDVANYVVVARQLFRSEAAAREAGKPREEELAPVVVNQRVAREQQRSEELRCGPFEGVFVYTPPPAARRAREVDTAATGVLLYRDGILVEPYGLPGDDWVGVEARKASRQGHAAIQPATFSGAVTISRHDNPDLEDMSNRLGLLDNEAFEDFSSHVRAEFAAFETLILEEVVEPRWKTPEVKATERARQAGSLATVRMRAIAHSVGQPLQGLGVELLRLEQLLKRHNLATDVREQLSSIAARMELYLNRLSGSVTKFADAPLPAFMRLAVGDLIESAMAEVAAVSAVEGVELVADQISDELVTVPKELVVLALVELLTNAIEVERADGRMPRVKVTTQPGSPEGAGSVLIRVQDNGTGFEGIEPGASLIGIESTKGRPSEGLPVVDNAIRVSNGRVEIEETGPDGTVMLVTLPKGLTPLS